MIRKAADTLFRAATHAIMALLAVTATTSCSQCELCYDHEHWVDVHIDFDWSKAPDAEPVTMVVYFFPDDEGSRSDHSRSFEFDGRNGGTIRLVAGNYKVVCFNGGTESLLERGSGFSDLHLTTEGQDILAPMRGAMMTGAPRPDTGRGEEVRRAPDRVWADACESFTVVPAKSGQRVKMTPVEATTRLTVTVEGVENLEPGITLSAAVTGMAEAMTLSDRLPYGKGATMPLGLDIMPDGSLYGSIDIFGHCPETSLQHTLTIYTSNRYYFNFDVTDKIHEAFTQGLHEINISIGSITIPKTDPDTGTGMAPDVNGWDEVVDVFIEMD